MRAISNIITDGAYNVPNYWCSSEVENEDNVCSLPCNFEALGKTE